MDEEALFLGDEIGPWSEVKLEIVREYATQYSRILTAQEGLTHIYIDGFAGVGEHRSKTTGALIPGSPLIALETTPPFAEYHFIDLQPTKAIRLEELAAGRNNVFIHRGDCNEILTTEVFPRVRWEDFRRGLCFLDPYGKQVRWETIATAGGMRTIDMLLHFPIGAINRTVLRKSMADIREADAAVMTELWGDESWREVAYQIRQLDLFGSVPQKVGYAAVARAFQQRLRDVAGFAHVPDPILMRNTKNVPLYYIFFASPKNTAERIIVAIFKKYRERA